MSLGFDAISALPFATAQTAGDVQVNVVRNQLSISIGNPAITADSITEIPNPNPLTLGTGTVTLNIDVNSGLTTTQFAVDTGEVAAITWSEIVPGVDMVWTPIDTN